MVRKILFFSLLRSHIDLRMDSVVVSFYKFLEFIYEIFLLMEALVLRDFVSDSPVESLY